MSLKRPPSDEPVSESKNIKIEEQESANVKNEPGDSADNVSAVKHVRLRDIQKNLRFVMLVHAENSGDFATGGLLSDLDLPCIPLIDIKNYGLLPTPLTKSNFDSVKEHCQDSPYGLGEETIIDKSVRNSIQVNPDTFEITNEIFAEKISQLINDKIKPKLGLKDAKINGKLYKLLIYESGGKFDEHRDTEKDDNMFGTLIIQLPSIFTGGNLVIKHNKKEKVYENSQAGSSTHCVFVAHYSSCPHKLEEVTSGYRVALIYSLCWDGNGIKPSPYIASTNTVKLCNLLNEYMDSPRTTFLSWALEYEYSNASLTNAKGAPSFFKGADKNVLSGLINALSYDELQYGKNRYEMYIATAKKHVQEAGHCGNDGYHGSWGRGCNGNCSGDFDIIESSVSLDEFVPLTETSLGADGLRTSFSPCNDILNYSHHINSDDNEKDYSGSQSDEEFWGSDNEDTGCSGPSGNEGATRELWYKKKVLVLWRSDCALAIKCKSSMSDGVNHVLQLIKHNNLEEAKKGLYFLSPSISTLSSKDTVRLIEISTALKIKDNIHLLFTNMQKWGISSEHSGKVIGEAAKQFLSDKNLDDLKELLKKCKKNQTQNILCCCNLVSALQPTEVIRILAQFTFKNENYYGYYSYGRHSDSKQTDEHEITLLIEYMFQNNTFPEHELKLVLDGITSLLSLCSLISVVVVKKDVIVINRLITRFVKLVSKLDSKTTKELTTSESSTIINDMIKLFQSQQKLQCLDVFISGVLSFPNNNQVILCRIVAHFTSNDKENLPDCLMKACRARLTYLEGVALKGKPGMSWNQPDAIVPGHPMVQNFLRGPHEKFIYRNFNGIRHARNWLSKHTGDSGCYMKLILGTAIGQKSYVEVVKTTQGYQKLLSVYHQQIAEYKRLVDVVDGYHDVTLQLGVTSTDGGKSYTSKCHDVIILD